MDFTILPFEYEGRYADQYADLGFSLEQAAWLEQRDRDLEDYLARVKAVDGKIPFLVAASDAADSTKAVASYLCTGTDDQDTIQLAVDEVFASDASDGRVLLSEGTFSLSGAVDCLSSTGPGRVEFEGMGAHATVVKLQSGATRNFYAFDGEGLGGLRNMTVRDLYGGTSDLFSFSIVQGCTFWGLDFGITVDTTGTIAITGNLFYDCDEGIVGTTLHECSIVGNKFENASIADISATFSGNLSIVGNQSTSSAAFCSVTYVDDDAASASGTVTITGNDVDDAAAGVTYASDGAAPGLTITGNTIKASGTALSVAAGATGGQRAVVVGNSLIGAVTITADTLLSANHITGTLTGVGVATLGVEVEWDSDGQRIPIRDEDNVTQGYVGWTNDRVAIWSGAADGLTGIPSVSHLRIDTATGSVFVQANTNDSGFYNSHFGGNVYAGIFAASAFVEVDETNEHVAIDGATVGMFGATGIDGTATPSTAAELADVLVALGVIASHTIA